MFMLMTVKSEKNAHGIRQLLEKKEGILRQKMMGKRVNYACRSVISPDPYLAVNEIGIPPVFATRLTYPEAEEPSGDVPSAEAASSIQRRPKPMLSFLDCQAFTIKEVPYVHFFFVHVSAWIFLIFFWHCFSLSPQKVTPRNAKELQQAIRNGADIHPGATHYRDNDNMYKLQAAPTKRRTIVKKLPASRGSISQPVKDPNCEFESKVVYRHLQDGDIVLVNRQASRYTIVMSSSSSWFSCFPNVSFFLLDSKPTLHKPSMMAHFVRVLPGEKTIRMHYANCSTYNADFDGDEMNVHFPQDEISRAEAMNIVNANAQYIGPRSGDVVRGLIQDHIVSAVLLTKQDTLLSREEYSHLVCGSCVPSNRSSRQPGKKLSAIKDDGALELVLPAILKPKPLWTGKQVRCF
ncbi:hypothetical protein HU200_058841 [Digitaria exilis]|uniref:DNA-directed RNA polymerase n=1 Tax=Digitaria exilis TaxID=1010633 RepID=A0A835ACY2_9POAL|nr:hypothetical protein HU200_058841 [Digitaria exilis]